MIQLYWEEYKIPKALFTNSLYQDMSNNAKLLYGILEDCMIQDMEMDEIKPGTLKKDEKGAIYINFPTEEMKRLLHIGNSTLTKTLKELENAGLLERRRRGLGRLDDIYIGKVKAAPDGLHK